eukprot:4981109-Pleurochrysis_carterae.AAC.2
MLLVLLHQPSRRRRPFPYREYTNGPRHFGYWPRVAELCTRCVTYDGLTPPSARQACVTHRCISVEEVSPPFSQCEARARRSLSLSERAGSASPCAPLSRLACFNSPLLLPDLSWPAQRCHPTELPGSSMPNYRTGQHKFATHPSPP